MSAELQLFEAFGVELEYMIVGNESLDVCPISDQLLRAVADEIVSEIELGEISWSNELALHVIELKTSQPAPALARLPTLFHEHVGRINGLLQPLGARLMPTAMHPWMHPERELKLWPHEYNPVYEAYNRIFDCRGHGWANLQSVHLNLPFSGDEQFGRLHAAIRLLLPLLPGLAASSPIVEGQLTGIADNRMAVYRDNARRIPLITADVVPEPVFSRHAYEEHIFQPMYRAIAPHDPDGILAHEWLNSRGAIARFDRNAIEIRVLDVQEHPAADLAICEAIVAVLQLLVRENWSSYSSQQQMPTAALAQVLQATTQHAEQAVVREPALLQHFGIHQPAASVADIWRALTEQVAEQIHHLPALRVILDQGTLSRRMSHALQSQHCSLQELYEQLCQCLAHNRPLRFQ